MSKSLNRATAPEPELSDREHPHRWEPHQYRAAGATYFVTFRVGGGVCLARPETVGRLVAALQGIGKRRNVALRAYCVMPDHVHLVVTTLPPEADLEKWLRYAKRETAKVLPMGAKWQRSYWDRTLRDWEDERSAVGYVMENPVRKGLCERWEDWPYCWSEWHQRSGPDGGPA